MAVTLTYSLQRPGRGGRADSLKSAFTLVELLVVVAIIVVLMLLAIPAFTNIKGARDLATTTYNIAGVLELARAYAMTNNTHVFVGFEETDASRPAAAIPQLSGTGRVAIAIVASRNGTSGYGNLPSNWSANYVNGSNLFPAGRLQYFGNVHLTEQIGYGGNMARPVVPAGCQVADGSFVSLTPFSWPLGSALNAGQYNFAKVIEFDPQGCAWIQSATYANIMVQYLEIGLQQANGAAIASGSDVAVIQIDGMTGSTQIYRP